MAVDLLLTHGYRLLEDPRERAIMKPYPPLGILYLSSYLKAAGYSVAVHDSTFAGPGAFDARLAEVRPRVVGIYANLMTRVNVLELIARSRAAGSFVVVGGPDPANHAARYLEAGAHVVVIGEGEATLAELLPVASTETPPARLARIGGLAFRETDGTLVRTPARALLPDLDAQPFPDREAIDVDRYVEAWRRHHGRGSVSLITARGCPYTCTWCSHAVYGYTHRRRSPGNVADEVERIVERYRPDMLWYADDVFTIHRGWLERYAEELDRRGLHVPFETITREDRLDAGVVATLARMGAFRVWVGAESGSQRVLDAMGRRTDAGRVPEVVHQLQAAGIEAGMFIMLGYEGEGIEDLEATLGLLRAANPDTFLTTVAYPIEGTPYAQLVGDRIVPLTDWHAGSDRDRTVAGRHSRRFYAHATRWIVNDVAYHRGRARGTRDLPSLARAWLKARAGRLGMRLSAREREPLAPDRR
jgi:radical SAM superfamily enzyme YgiQ (UPF0313 family)